MTQVLYKGRLIPESVKKAIDCGDHQRLKELSKLGQVAKAQRKEWCERQGVLNLPKPHKSRKSMSAESRVKAAETRAFNKALLDEARAIALEDALKHAEDNRIGWDDDYRP
jgi:hypothetical protein